jgi:hypothetical protein
MNYIQSGEVRERRTRAVLADKAVAETISLDLDKVDP